MGKSGMTITIIGGAFAVKTPRKDDFFLTVLKDFIPPKERAWKPEHMAWLVAPQAKAKLQSAITRAGYDMPAFPAITSGPAKIEQKQIRVEYLGQCKEREDKSITALGQVDGYWSLEIPEDVLKAFFDRQGGKPLLSACETHYQVLCVFENSTPDQIKAAFRQLSRQWHPDVCSEPEGPDKFMAIKAAYDILRDPQARKRYDFGLHFEREAAKRLKEQETAQAPAPTFGRRRRPKFLDNPHYRAPLRCGLVTVEGVEALSKFKVTKILSWVDATDDQGRTMTATWSKDAKCVQIRWI